MSRNEAFNTLFANGMSYEDYVQRSDRHQERMQLSSTATDHYLSETDPELKEAANHPMKVVCIAENWCGDCANGVPVIAKMAEVMDNWTFKIAPRDDYEDLVEQYYTTAGRKKIPVIIFADEDGDEVTRWVERPTQSYQILADLQARKLPKEEYISEYKSNPSLKPPKVSHIITDELLNAAVKTASMLKIMPKKR